MSIRWTKPQRARVQAVLARHPAESGRCRLAATSVLPIGEELDADAHARAILPDPRVAPGARYVEPDRRWFFHITVSVLASYVDALTGADGASSSSYLQTHFPDTFDAVTVQRIDLATWSEP